MPEERKFLHDLASPLTTIQLNLENALTLLKENCAGHESPAAPALSNAVAMIESALTQSERVRHIISGRRDNLVAKGKKK